MPSAGRPDDLAERADEGYAVAHAGGLAGRARRPPDDGRPVGRGGGHAPAGPDRSTRRPRPARRWPGPVDGRHRHRLRPPVAGVSASGRPSWPRSPPATWPTAGRLLAAHGDDPVLATVVRRRASAPTGLLRLLRVGHVEWARRRPTGDDQRDGRPRPGPTPSPWPPAARHHHARRSATWRRGPTTSTCPASALAPALRRRRPVPDRSSCGTAVDGDRRPAQRAPGAPARSRRRPWLIPARGRRWTPGSWSSTPPPADRRARAARPSAASTSTSSCPGVARLPRRRGGPGPGPARGHGARGSLRGGGRRPVDHPSARSTRDWPGSTPSGSSSGSAATGTLPLAVHAELGRPGHAVDRLVPVAGPGRRGAPPPPDSTRRSAGPTSPTAEARDRGRRGTSTTRPGAWAAAELHRPVGACASTGPGFDAVGSVLGIVTITGLDADGGRGGRRGPSGSPARAALWRRASRARPDPPARARPARAPSS